jgi:hypothetical protein
LIPTGGQQHPTSGVGANLLWKNAQKNAMKKHTSDKINNSIPYRSPLATYDVCWPKKVPSRETSRHHWYIDSIVTARPIIKHVVPYPWNQHVNPEVNKNAPIAEVRGQGLGSTK